MNADVFVFMENRTHGMVLFFTSNGVEEPEKCDLLSDAAIGDAPNDVSRGLYRVRCQDRIPEPKWNNSSWSDWARKEWECVEWRAATPHEALALASGDWDLIDALPFERKT